MASRPGLNLSTRLSAFCTSSSFICCWGGGPWARRPMSTAKTRTTANRCFFINTSTWNSRPCFRRRRAGFLPSGGDGRREGVSAMMRYRTHSARRSRRMSMTAKSSLLILVCFGLISLASGCKKKGGEPPAPAAQAAPEFSWKIDQFADLQILRYQVPGFEALTPAQKELVYDLSQAALCGRDIFFDQNYKYNLRIRHTLDAVVAGYKGDRNEPRWGEFMTYVKRVWFSNGIHHHYSNDKIMPGFDAAYFATLVKGSEGAAFPLAPGQSVDDLIAFLTPILFDPAVAAKKVSQDTAKDLVTSSAVNFYEGVTQAEVEAYYRKVTDE